MAKSKMPCPRHTGLSREDGQPWGEKQIDPEDCRGWLETEWWEGLVSEAGRSAGNRAPARVAGGSQRRRSSGEAE